MWVAVQTAISGLATRQALLAMVLIALAQLGMLWRRRSARHTARQLNEGRTTVFDHVLKVTSRAQYAAAVIAGIQELGIQSLRFYHLFC
jgi:hypothetical protein